MRGAVASVVLVTSSDIYKITTAICYNAGNIPLGLGT
jgi:hypothetical protein